MYASLVRAARRCPSPPTSRRGTPKLSSSARAHLRRLRPLVAVVVVHLGEVVGALAEPLRRGGHLGRLVPDDPVYLRLVAVRDVLLLSQPPA